MQPTPQAREHIARANWLDDFGRKLAREDARWIADQVAPLPPSFAALVLDGRERRIKAQAGSEGLRDGNTWMRRQVEKLDRFDIDLAASDAEIGAFADVCANDVRSLLMSATATDRATFRSRLDRFAERKAGHHWGERATLQGIIGRMTDAAWWRRVLRKHVGRGVEQSARELGLVHRHKGLYCSDETMRWHASQQQRNRQAIEGQEAVNQFGQVFALDELADKGLSKAANRRADLMVRARGCDDFAQRNHHAGLFITWTAPSAYHPRRESGHANPRYVEGRTPRDAHHLLCRQFAKARAVLDRLGIKPYGFRVVEPHHDGTPHWHMLVFMPKAQLAQVISVLRRYAEQPHPEEMTSQAARHARFAWKRIDWKRGTAAGYIAKYIAKNIDGQGEQGAIGADFEAAGDTSATDTAGRVRAWASRWGIRQFQPLGQPHVTAYRELRRIRKMDADQGELFELWRAADGADWCAFMERDGGADCRRADRPAQVWRDEQSGKANRYGEPAAPAIVGITWRGAGVVTRVYEWEIRKAGHGSNAGRSGGSTGAVSRFAGFSGRRAAQAPWTRVNNCTRPMLVHSGFNGQDDEFPGLNTTSPTQRPANPARRTAAHGLNA
jgi:hypothetical protein